MVVYGGDVGILKTAQELVDTWDDVGSLQKIDGKSIHRICSGQVIVDMASAVKELIENSIDAKATSIRIIIEQGGFKTIQITDNGTGINTADYHSIALKHFTSKIRNFEDLQNGVDSLGFRGEALSSLCALSRNVSITTRTAIDDNGVRIRYDSNGSLVDITPTSHPVGTTVKVENIFQPAPVRLESFRKKHKREYNKIIVLIQEYSVAHNNITFQLSGEPFKNTKTSKSQTRTLLSTTGNGNLKDAISAVFGFQQVNALEEFSYASETVKITGFISKLETNCGRRSGDRQHYTLNERPVDLPRFSRILNEYYRKSNPYKYPVIFLSCEIPKSTFDINISPNKRAVMLENETNILTELREHISSTHWSLQSNVFTPSPILRSQSSASVIKASQSTPTSSMNFSGRLQSLRNFKSPLEQIDEIDEFLATPPSPVPVNLQTKTMRRTQSSPGLSSPTESASLELTVWNPTPVKFRKHQESIDNCLSNIYRNITGNDELEEELQKLLYEKSNEIRIKDDHELVNEFTTQFASVHDTIDPPIDVQFTLSQLEEKIQQKNKYQEQENAADSQNFRSKYFATLDTPEDESFQELSRVFDKGDFHKINICGQFNRGFIVGKLGNDLFIFDQHACDEKYNYERLYRNLEIKVQPLLHSQKLHLPAGDEDIIISEREIFKMNGFHFNYMYNEAAGRRISLASVPYSKNTNFSVEDVMELVEKLRENPGIFCRPSKIQKMMASRACRSSIMIGQSLSATHMRQVTMNMTNLDNPWCCPHGRPTMRHLYTIPH